MGKRTQTTTERATGNYIRPASPLPNAQQHSGERRRQTGPKRATGSSKTKGVRQRREGTSTLKRAAHCGRTLCKPRTASHLAAAVFAVRVVAAAATAVQHLQHCNKRILFNMIYNGVCAYQVKRGTATQKPRHTLKLRRSSLS